MDGLDSFHKKALEILRSDKTKKAFDLTQEKQEPREAYGTNGFGQGVLAARRLVEAGVRFVTVSLGGWDTHRQELRRRCRRQRLPALDPTLSALIQDLSDHGMLDRTIVYCAGEFGRTPKVNKNAGRDHWARSMSVVLAGGGFKGGYVHGTTDAEGMAPATEPCTPDDVSSTIFRCLGIDRNRTADRHGPAGPAVPRRPRGREAAGVIRWQTETRARGSVPSPAFLIDNAP